MSRHPSATMRQTDAYQADYAAPLTLLPPGRGASYVSHVFAGAKESALLQTYTDQLGTPIERAIDWGWFRWFMKPIFSLLLWLYTHIGNFGVAIICLTLIVRTILFPIAQKQFKSMAAMRAIQPKMKAIQERYADDRMTMQQEVMKLYKEEKANPAAGCLPTFLQIPVFYALYKVLMVSVEMRHKPFVLWIQDLSAPDPLTPINLFGYLPFTPPHFLALGILPILLGITMWLQMRLNPQVPDPVQRQVFALMPWVLMFVMAGFAAGLQLYWVTNNCLTILQQKWLYSRNPALRAQSAGNVSDDPEQEDSGLEDAALEEAAQEALRRAGLVPEIGAGAEIPARSGRAGDRLRRPLQCRQIVPAQPADQPQRPRPHLQHAGPDPGAEHLRGRRAGAAAPRRHARLRLRQGAEGLARRWRYLVNDYLRGRQVLKRTLLLIDSRHGFKDVDREVMKMLDDAAVSYRVILTKADKIKASDLADVTHQTQEEARRHPAAHPEIIVTSSEKGLGMDRLRAAVLEAGLL